MKKIQKIKPQDLLTHKTKRHASVKFILLLVTLLSYFAWLSWHYGIITGGSISLLTWSFFVLCTPIADGGFLIDFPLRVLFHVRMWVSEMFVWGLAILIAIWGIIFIPEIFETTELTSFFFKIITNLWPFGLIILLSGAGTFLSVHFGDELIDRVEHKDCAFHHKHQLLYQLILIAGLLTLVFWGYGHILDQFDVTLSIL